MRGHFEVGKSRIFKGIDFSTRDTAKDETIDIATPATISNVTLNLVSGAFGEMYFNRLSGSPSKTGTIIISSPNFTKTIRISATGVVSVD